MHIYIYIYTCIYTYIHITRYVSTQYMLYMYIHYAIHNTSVVKRPWLIRGTYWLRLGWLKRS